MKNIFSLLCLLTTVSVLSSCAGPNGGRTDIPTDPSDPQWILFHNPNNQNLVGDAYCFKAPCLQTTYAFGGSNGTTDTDLQLAQAQQSDLDSRAQALAQKFEMNLSSATSLAVLADKVQALGGSNQLSQADRDAITASALSVAGLKQDEVATAVAEAVKEGNSAAIEGLMGRAAMNLGMKDSARLRAEILPALGIQF